MNTGFKVIAVTNEKANATGNGVSKTLTLAKLYTDSFSGKVSIEEGRPVARTIFSGVKDTNGKLTSTNTLSYSELVVGDMREGVAEIFKTSKEYPIVTYDAQGAEVSRRMVNSFTAVAFRGENPVAIANAQLIQHGVRVLVDGEDQDMSLGISEDAKLATRVQSRAERAADKIKLAKVGNGVKL